MCVCHMNKRLLTYLLTYSLVSSLHCWPTLQGGPKTDSQFYFWDNFGNSTPILTIVSLLQAEIYGA